MIDSIFNDIAPAQALGIEVKSWAGGRIELTAPLAPNLNDKGTAFAGSVSSILTLAGWAAITLSLKEHGIDADVMVVTSETTYTAAIRDDLCAEAAIPSDEVGRIARELSDRGRSRVTLKSAIPTCVSMESSYAILRRKPSAA